MTDININGLKVDTVGVSGVKSVSFSHLDHKVYSAEKIESICGYFLSNVINCGNGYFGWNTMVFDATKPIGTDIAIYVRSSSDSVYAATWMGPYFNASTDISDLKGQYLQFLIVMCNNGQKSDYDNYFSTPVFRRISLSYYSYNSTSKFYTRSFDLGFLPKQVLLTYNGEIEGDSVVRFAVSGMDSIDPDDYQYINANEISQLTELSDISTKFKVMIEMLSDTVTIPVVINEFALMFSGDDQLRLNKISSSSSFSSSSSSSVSSSSFSSFLFSSSSYSSSSSSSLSSGSSSSSSSLSSSSSSSSLSSSSSSSLSSSSSSSSSSVSSSSFSSSSVSSESSSSSSSVSSSSFSSSSVSSESSSSSSSVSSSSFSSSSVSSESSSSSGSSSSVSSESSSSSSSSVSSDSSMSSSSVSSDSSMSSSSVSSDSSMSSSSVSSDSSSSSSSYIFNWSSSSFSSSSSSSSFSSSSSYVENWSSSSNSSSNSSSSSSGGLGVGLLLHYKMNDNAANTTVIDSKGTSNGTVAVDNTSTMTQTGKINASLQFDETTDTIIDSNYVVSEQSFTVSFWWYRSSGSCHVVGTALSSAVQEGWIIYDYGGVGAPIGCYMSKGDNWWNIGGGGLQTTVVTTVEAWYLIQLTYDGSTGLLSFFINGNADNTQDQSADKTITYDGGTLHISWPNNAPANGRVDDFRFYNRVLTTTELRNIWNGGSGTEKDY